MPDSDAFNQSINQSITIHFHGTKCH